MKTDFNSGIRLRTTGINIWSEIGLQRDSPNTLSVLPVSFLVGTNFVNLSIVLWRTDKTELQINSVG